MDLDWLRLLRHAADAVADSLAGFGRWEERGDRAGQYALDQAADAAAVGVLTGAGVGVLSEEAGLIDGAGSELVIVDPVDGSTNASRRIAHYCVSLCAVRVDAVERRRGSSPTPVPRIGRAAPADRADPLGRAGPVGRVDPADRADPLGHADPAGAVGRPAPADRADPVGPVGRVDLADRAGPLGRAGPVGRVGLVDPVGLAVGADVVPTAALVRHLVTGEEFWAIADGAAFTARPGAAPRRIAPRPSISASDAIVAVSGRPSPSLPAWQVRIFGAAALDLCAVACGRVDAYADLDAGHGVWDYAAGVFICERAGAFVTSTDGRALLHLEHSRRVGPLAAADAAYGRLLRDAISADCG